MRVLVADDDQDLWPLLRVMLEGAGHDVEFVADGDAAWERIGGDLPPQAALLDWQMPGADGFELCRRLRARETGPYVYAILLTSHGGEENFVAGIEAGADDFLAKPAAPAALLSRFKVAERILDLERTLRGRVDELESAVARIRNLEGLLPVCMHCRRIRDDADKWQSLEDYARERGVASFTHGLCEACRDEHYPIEQAP